MRRIKGLVAVLLAVCTVFSVTGCDTVERIKERISQETVDDEKVADENKTEVSNSISVGLLDFDTFNPLLTCSVLFYLTSAFAPHLPQALFPPVSSNRIR